MRLNLKIKRFNWITPQSLNGVIEVKVDQAWQYILGTVVVLIVGHKVSKQRKISFQNRIYAA
ncbi:MAG: hypothetical protein ACFFDI_18905 [Promethearchaeota archaeon]